MKLRFKERISFIVIFSMIVQMALFSCAITVSAATSVNVQGTIVENGEDYFNAAKLKGAYIEASFAENSHIGSHINVLCTAARPDYPTDLVPASDAERAAGLGWTEELLATVAANAYVTKDKDGAWMYRVQQANGIWLDADYAPADADIKDIAFYSQGNYRIRSGAAQGIGGAIYLKLDDTFTTSDTDITFVVEYLDVGTRALGLTHPNTTSVKGSVGFDNHSITKTNTGLWKTAVFTSTNAMLKTGFSGLGTHQEDIKLNANSDAMYIKRVGVIKTADLKADDSSDFDVSNVSYKTDKGAATHYVAGGKVVTTADVTNNGEAANSATLYTAVYDKGDNLVDVAKSAKADIAVGETATLTTTTAVNIPNKTDYTFRKFIWTDSLTPAYSVDESDKLVLTATPFDRRILLSWSEYSSEIPMENTVFYIYRDGNLIGSSKKSAYYDDIATVGEHSWRIEAIDETTGDVIYRSNYALATVIDKLANSGVYVKARQGAATNFQAINNKHSDIEGGLHIYRIANVYTLDEVQNYLTYVTDETPAEGAAQTLGQIAYAKANNIKYITNASDGSTRTMRVTDASGVTKDAWQTGKLLRCANNTEYSVREPFIYVDVTDTSKITTEDSNVAVFVEFLAKDRNNLYLQYISYTEAEDGTKTVAHKNTPAFKCVKNGRWTVAQFNISDAYFTSPDSTKFYSGGPDFRIVANGGDVVVSSVYVTTATGSDAVYEYTSLRDRDFGAVATDTSNALYPDGVSVDFSTGTAVENGIKLHASQGGTANNSATISENGYAENTYIEVDGAPKQTRLNFEVDDAYVFGHADCDKLYFEIEYVDDFTGDLKLNHNQWKGWYEVPVYGGADDTILKGTGSGEVKTYKGVISNIQMRNTHGDGNADFYFWVPYGENRDTLKIKSLKIKNLSALDREYLAE